VSNEHVCNEQTIREKKIRAIIVDDEELARAILRESLSHHSDVELVAECANGFEAVKAATDLKPDLLFLDVQMPKLDGFEVLELVGTEAAIVFVTAYDQYALRAFEVHAVDYLLKPYSEDRFKDALDHARQHLGGKQEIPEKLALSARAPGQYAERIVLRDGSNVHIIPTAKLDYAEAQDDYVALASGGKKLLKSQAISALEETLDPTRFIRIHRSYILNLDRLKQLEPYSKDSHVAILTDGSRLPVSKSGLARLKTVLDTKG
jgi:two-component system LytT family response regulator